MPRESTATPHAPARLLGVTHCNTCGGAIEAAGPLSAVDGRIGMCAACVTIYDLEDALDSELTRRLRPWVERCQRYGLEFEEVKSLLEHIHANFEEEYAVGHGTEERDAGNDEEPLTVGVPKTFLFGHDADTVTHRYIAHSDWVTSAAKKVVAIGDDLIVSATEEPKPSDLVIVEQEGTLALAVWPQSKVEYVEPIDPNAEGEPFRLFPDRLKVSRVVICHAKNRGSERGSP